jgi:hypothetical protein
VSTKSGEVQVLEHADYGILTASHSGSDGVPRQIARDEGMSVNELTDECSDAALNVEYDGVASVASQRLERRVGRRQRPRLDRHASRHVFDAQESEAEEREYGPDPDAIEPEPDRKREREENELLEAVDATAQS